MLILLLSCAPSEDFDWSTFPSCDRVLEETGEETVLGDLEPDGTTVVCAGLHEAGHEEGVFTGDVDRYRLSFDVPVEATVAVYSESDNEVHAYLFSEDGFSGDDTVLGTTADSGEVLPSWRPYAGVEETLQVGGYQGAGGAYAVEIVAVPLLRSGNVEADWSTACTVVVEGVVVEGTAAEGEVLCWGEWGEELTRLEPEVRSLEVGQNTVCGVGGSAGILCWDPFGAEVLLDPAFVGVAASGYSQPHRCAWDAEGAVTCWKDDSDGTEAWLQFPGTAWSHVRVGFENTCAIDPLGAVTCTGTLPSPSGTFSDLSLGQYLACGVHADNGTLQCWYDDASETAADVASRVPTDEGGYEQVVVGFSYACALREGSVDCWEDEVASYAQLVDGIPEGEHFTRIAGANQTVCGVRDDGALSCWGFDRRGLVSDTP